MSVHFAAARCTTRSPLARILAKKSCGKPANDNGNAALAPIIDQRTRDALLHFAAHGLDAANVAARQAETAAAIEDSESYDRWLGICDALDTREAARVREASRDDYLIG